MSFKFAARLVAAVLGLFVAAAAQAEIIAFEFRGKLTYSTYMAPVGTPIVGRFGWDAATPPGPPMMPGYNAATYSRPATVGMWARVGLHTAISTNLTVTVYDNVYGTGQDMIDINGFVPVVDGTTYREGALAINMVTALGDPDVFTSLALPRTLDAKLFQAQRFALLQSDGAEGG